MDKCPLTIQEHIELLRLELLNEHNGLIPVEFDNLRNLRDRVRPWEAKKALEQARTAAMNEWKSGGREAAFESIKLDHPDEYI